MIPFPFTPTDPDTDGFEGRDREHNQEHIVIAQNVSGLLGPVVSFDGGTVTNSTVFASDVTVHEPFVIQDAAGNDVRKTVDDGEGGVLDEWYTALEAIVGRVGINSDSTAAFTLKGYDTSANERGRVILGGDNDEFEIRGFDASANLRNDLSVFDTTMEFNHNDEASTITASIVIGDYGFSGESSVQLYADRAGSASNLLLVSAFNQLAFYEGGHQVVYLVGDDGGGNAKLTMSDTSDQARAVLSTNGSGLTINDADGNNQATLAEDAGGGVLTLWDEAGADPQVLDHDTLALLLGLLP